MRPLRLDLHGFTVFRDPTTVDFTDTDFFALVGPTGSGKSTVLDAMCFALYGTVPRWSDRRSVANALAPSAAEARVRLVFEAAGSRYAATRVVRRDGKGRIATTHAGLELLPRGFDLSTLDSGLVELGEPLAGTPTEMEAAVLGAVGLPYEQFTSCVVLPQGQFAEFLHAKPAARQQILVNLLGLSVYERIRDRAGAEAAKADAHLEATDRLLADLSDASDEALDVATARVAAMRELGEAVEAAVPALGKARQDAADAATTLADLDRELALLSQVKAPADAQRAAQALAAAQTAIAQAQAAVTTTEEREEKLRGELAAAGDPTALHRLLDEYAERDRVAAQLAELAGGVERAEGEHAKATGALEAATMAAAEITAVVAEAERGVEAARTHDRAATLRPHLRAGEPCPVCAQTVTTVPAMPDAPALKAANAALATAQKRAETVQRKVSSCDKAVRDLDRTLAAVRAQRDQLHERQSTLDGRLTSAPGVAEARAALTALDTLAKAVDEASGEVRRAREDQRRVAAGAEQAQARLRAAWKTFDGVRDAVAPLGPPPADREDLAGAWQTLAGWASSEVDGRRVRRDGLSDRRRAAESALTTAARAVEDLFAGAGIAAPRDPAGYSRAAAVALAKAESDRDRIVDKRAQADEVRAQRAGYEQNSQVAKALANHLRANNFERWLLEEALDLLVEGASGILRELSGGQYELVHDKGEFFVVDHHDAALRRAVRTLSGGETFQASLSLALALSEQLAGMSTGAASLESIVLDEGFGTLDVATLDMVAATLENLAARGDRMVGVVTHVPALAERIPVRYEVRKDARSARIERVGL
ncbi:MAG: chromosome segregation protein SMC [Actinobacteria bacterium 13_2_20CM_2_71_6]|nr:MAG: chromosome segregation protein SMC [Actinobacteria bacterium 13_2_20CM_2_71_6]